MPNFKRGGVENSLLRISKVLLNNDFKIFITTRDSSKINFKHKNLKIFEFNLFNKQNFFFDIIDLIYLSKKSLKLNLPIITFQSPLIILFLNSFLKNKILICIRESNTIKFSIGKNLKMYLNLIQKKICWTLAYKIICVSKDSYYQNIKFIRHQKKNVELIYNPINKSELINLSKEKINYNFDKKKFHICALGRVTFQKNYSYLIDIIHFLSKKLSLQLHIIGDGDELTFIKKKVKKLNLENDIVFHGYLNNPFKILKECNLLINTSLYEGIGNILIESLYLNVNVVSSNSPGGAKEILDNGNCGLLIDINSKYNINADIIFNYIMDKQLRKNHLNSFKKSCHIFNENISINKYKNIFL